jgi:hypothetical protein
MASSASGDLESSSRVRLFPLPFFACRSPHTSSRSARVRARRILYNNINHVTNRLIAELNRMYNSSSSLSALSSSAFAPSSPAAAVTPLAASLPPASSHSTFSLHSQPDQLSRSSPSPSSNSSSPSAGHSLHCVPTPSCCCTSSRASTSTGRKHSLPPLRCHPTHAQLRLMTRLRHQCASFACSVRFGCSAATSAAHASASSLTALFLAPSPPESGSLPLPNHAAPASAAAAPSLPIGLPPHSLIPILPSLSTHSSASTAVVPLVAGRVALPESLRIIPFVSLLPPSVAATYSHAAQSAALLRSPVEVLELDTLMPLRPPRVAGSRREYVRLLSRLLSQGMVSFTATPKAVNGVFTVAKDSTSDRLIIDAQPANRLFRDPPHVSLPDPSHLIQLQVPQGQRMFVGKSDLSNYYHHLGLPEWLQPYFALPELSASELQQLGLPSDSPARFPCCCTVPMGWSHAVYVANSVHEFVLYSSGAASADDNLLSLSSPEVTHHRVLHGIIIDDFFCFSLSQGLADRLFARVLAAYRAAGFVVKESKAVAPTTAPIKVIGFEIDGAASTIVLPLETRIDLVRCTLGALHSRTLTGLQLAHLIGRWTWCMLVRRATLSVLQHCYRYIEEANRRRFILWPSVRRELWTLVCLLPLMHSRFDAPIYSRALASDASELAGGVTCAPLTAQLHSILWPLCSSRAHASMQAIVRARPLQLQQHPQPLTELQALVHSCSSAYERFYSHVLSTRWSIILSHRWRAWEHINALELRAVLLSLHWLLSFPSSHLSRVYLLVDSMVAFFTLWKGRSSSPKLLLVLRKISALLLASGVMLLPGWIPSEVNPADAPSRLLQ